MWRNYLAVLDMRLYDVQGIVERSIRVARQTGRDYVSQSRQAALDVVAVRSDISFSEALIAVSRFRDRASK